MARIQRVSGPEFDGTCVEVYLGRFVIPALKMSYGDKLSPEKVTSMGSQKIDAQTPGAYSVTDGKMTVQESVWRTVLAPMLVQQGAGNVITEMLVAYTHQQIGSDSDLLSNVRILGLDSSLETGGKPFEKEVAFTYTQIYWTDRRVTINRLQDLANFTSPGLSLF